MSLHLENAPNIRLPPVTVHNFREPNLFYADTFLHGGGGGRFAPEWFVDVIWHLTYEALCPMIGQN